MTGRVLWLTFALALAGAPIGLAADGGSVVVWRATGAVLVDGSELPKDGLGLWRIEPGSTVEAKDGFVELKIGEDGWLRSRPGTVIKLASASDQAIEMEVQQGSAVLDLLSKPDVGEIRLRVGESSLSASGKGSFLAEASPGRLAALKGKADATVGGRTVALKPKTAVATDGPGEPEKLAKLEDDAFEAWREERNNELIREQRRADTFAERTIRPAR